METQRQYLRRLGLLDSSDPQRLQQAKAAYRKAYKQAKNREYRTSRHYLRLTLTSKEKSQLTTGAKRHRKALATYVREIALAYQKRVYILPSEDMLTRLETACHRIGNNINQIAKKCNSENSTRYFDVVRLREQVTALEKEVNRYLRQPMTLDQLIRVELPKHPELIPELNRFLKKHQP